MTRNRLDMVAMIAERCGWKRTDPGVWERPGQYGYCLPLALIDGLPRYFEQLDAMRSAETTLSDDEWIQYQEALCVICKPDPRVVNKHLIHASADERARAFMQAVFGITVPPMS